MSTFYRSYPPTIYDYLRVGLFIMYDPFTDFVFSSKVG